MSKKFLFTTAVILLGILGFTACSGGFIPVTGNEGQQPDLQATQNYQIIQAAQATATQLAAETQAVQEQPTSQPVVITATPSPELPTNTPTQEPTPTQTATQLPPTATVILPTQTPVIVFVTPLPSATPLPCNAAGFVADVTVPDGTVFTPGSSFTKTWRLRNTGTCTWNTNYDLVFYDGNNLNGPVSVDLPGNVAPDQVIDVSVNLSAPSSTGTYRSNWKLRTDGGILFGLNNNRSFYVEIKVENPTSQYPYDFAAAFCSATWTSSAGNLPCPGQDNDSRGFVLRFDKPQLETGQIDDEPGLLTNPQLVNDGVIRGKYPAIRVENGYRFQSLIGCAHNAKNCDVKFQLDYQIGDGAIQTLGTWSERYEELTTQVNVDLSSLAGKDVKFILTVFANGASDNDRALWLAPRITKP